MNTNLISGMIVNAALRIHREVGPGLLESVYEIILADELIRRGLHVRRQVAIPVHFEGRDFDEGFRADLLVNETVIVELKSIEQIANVHKKQLLTYLKLSGKKLGLLINFGGDLLKNNIHRLINGLPESECAPTT